MAFEHQYTAVDPVSPAAPYLGGKRALAKTIIARINEIPHDGYAEPFVGMGGVFLRRTFRPHVEAINDISGDVANLFRILQRHYPQFMETLRFQVTSRREYERLVKTDPATLTDLERAARFLYLQRLAFGGKISGRNFGVDKTSAARFNLLKLAPLLEEIHERLAGTVIEQLAWQEFIRRYDRPGMLFYLDPPYWGNENDYGKGVFSRDEFAEMAECLAGIEGRFILSINDVPQIREIFARFELHDATLRYSVAGGKAYMPTAPKGEKAFPTYFGKDKLSVTVNKYMRENGLLETDGHTLYGLRHSFEDRMTAAEPAWPERMKCDVFGHALSRQRYGEIPITIERVRYAHGVAAELAANNPILTPVFERLDRELKAMISTPVPETRLEMTVRRRKEIRELI